MDITKVDSDLRLAGWAQCQLSEPLWKASSALCVLPGFRPLLGPEV